jgi:hypothetical protein
MQVAAGSLPVEFEDVEERVHDVTVEPPSVTRHSRLRK